MKKQLNARHFSVSLNSLNGLCKDINERYLIANMLSIHFTFSELKEYTNILQLYQIFPRKSALKTKRI